MSEAATGFGTQKDGLSVGGSRRKYAEAPLSILSRHSACVRSAWGLLAVEGVMVESKTKNG